jgi:coenzyme F420-reducing hydrogenase delta subunit
MGIGPPGRDGRSQLARVRTMLAGTSPFPDVVVINCLHGLAELGGEFCVPIDCLGNLHTSTVELCLRSGASGVLVVSCAMRDCKNREGGRWLEQRLFHGREAELQSRVDRRRIRLVALGGADVASASAALARFRVELTELDRREQQRNGPLGGECLTAASRAAPGKVA